MWKRLEKLKRDPNKGKQSEMSTCDLCLDWMGTHETHEGECPIALSVLCLRCHEYGHRTSTCPDRWAHWERPTCLEDLIPADLRRQYGICTSTPLVFDEARGAGTDEEIAKRMLKEKVPLLLVPEAYKELGTFMEQHKIVLKDWVPNSHQVTKDTQQERMKAVKAWALKHGYSMRIVPT